MRVTLLALSALLLLAPGASACFGGLDGQAVAPLLDMQFPDKKKCKAPDHSDCTLAPGETFRMEGKLTWQWDVDNCEATNIAISVDPIVIDFPDFPRNPTWLKLSMDPPQISIPFEQQWDLLDDKIDPATQKITMYEEWPITVTIERVGDPTPEEQDKIDAKNGVVEMYAKAVSSETDGFQPGFAFENFRFSAQAPGSATSGSNDAPAPSFAFLALALVAVAVALRRR